MTRAAEATTGRGRAFICVRARVSATCWTADEEEGVRRTGEGGHVHEGPQSEIDGFIDCFDSFWPSAGRGDWWRNISWLIRVFDPRARRRDLLTNDAITVKIGKEATVFLLEDVIRLNLQGVEH